MLVNLLFLAVLSSGSVFCAAFFQKKYEQILPLTAMGAVLVLFIFGVCGALKAGFYAVLVLTLMLYGATVFWLVLHKNLKSFLKNTITTGTVVFLGIFVLLSFWNRGMMASAWDEFTHWMDITKVMTTLDDFGTNSAANSAFKAYPPAMALFQYLLQKLFLLVNPKAVFIEWRVYLAYQLFFVTLLMPFFTDLSWRKPIKLMCVAVAAFVLPLLFYSNLYISVYIDAFLGLLAGAGLAAVFLCRKKDVYYTLYVLMICAVLVLTKDLGLFLAIMLAFAYGVDAFLSPVHTGEGKPAAVAYVKKYGLLVLSFGAVFVPKLLWNLELKTAGITASSGIGADVKSVFALLFGETGNYRDTVVDNFRNALFEKRITLGNSGLSLNYFAMILVSIALACVAYKLFVCANPECSRRKKGVLAVAVLQPIIYFLGVCIVYAFRFSEYEAVRLASYERYVNVILLASWLSAALVIISGLHIRYADAKMCSVVILCALLVIAPMKPLVDFADGASIVHAKGVRKNYDVLSNKIMRITQGKQRVYLISQGTTGLDYWILRYSVRPNSANGNFTWSIGEKFYDGDVWTMATNAEQWQQTLLKDYDYVALYKVNDYFAEHFSVLFAEPDTIANDTVYKVNKETGLLDFCE